MAPVKHKWKGGEWDMGDRPIKWNKGNVPLKIKLIKGTCEMTEREIEEYEMRSECADCVVGIRYHHELTDLITRSEFDELSATSIYDPNVMDEIKKFRYCPHCGREIGWKRRNKNGCGEISERT